MDTMDLGLAALVADDAAAHAAMAALAMAGVGLAAVLNMRGRPIDLQDVPAFPLERVKWADIVHPDYPSKARRVWSGYDDATGWLWSGAASWGDLAPVGAESFDRDEREVYRDWLLDSPDPDAALSGQLLGLSAWGEPSIVFGRDADVPAVTRIVCENVELDVGDLGSPSYGCRTVPKMPEHRPGRWPQRPRCAGSSPAAEACVDFVLDAMRRAGCDEERLWDPDGLSYGFVSTRVGPDWRRPTARVLPVRNSVVIVVNDNAPPGFLQVDPTMGVV